MVIRSFTVFVSISYINRTQAGESWDWTSESNLKLPFMTFSAISCLVFPLKGGNPLTIQNKIQPIAQISRQGCAGVFVSSTSGAIYHIEPASVYSIWTFDYVPAIPKSTTFICKVSQSTSIIFSNFRSQWIIFSRWQ